MSAHSYIYWDRDYQQFDNDVSLGKEHYLDEMVNSFSELTRDIIETREEVTMAGKRYGHVIMFRDRCGTNSGTAVLALCKKAYKFLSFTFGRIDGTFNWKGGLTIYLNNMLVLRLNMAASDPPQTFTLPLRDANLLRISISNTSYCLAEALLQ